MEQRRHFDLVASLALIALGGYVLVSGYGIFRDAGETFYVSPGFFPVLLGGVLILCSLLLLRSSLAEGGFAARAAELGAWWREKVRSRAMATALAGMGIMFLYSFVLLSILPFWIASVLFLAGLMFFLRSASLPKILILSAATVALIVLFFQVCFGIPLP